MAISDDRVSSLLTSCSRNFSPAVCSFFFFVEYDIIFPLSPAFAVSQNVLAVMSGVLLVSRKDAHSSLKYVVKSGSLSRDILKRHLGVG